MLLNKNDFESGLMQDQMHSDPIFKPPAMGVGQNVPVVGGKGNLFGPPGNLNQGGFGFEKQQRQANAEAKSKRDLLWEQKRKQKLDFISPPTNNAFQPPAPSIQFEAPKGFDGFQKAVSFDQPVQVIEIQPVSNMGIMGAQQPIMENNSVARGLSPRIGMENPAHNSFQPSFNPPLQIGKKEIQQVPQPNSIWDQVNNQQPIQHMNDAYSQFKPPQIQQDAFRGGPPSEISGLPPFLMNNQQSQSQLPYAGGYDSLPRNSALQQQPSLQQPPQMMPPQQYDSYLPGSLPSGNQQQQQLPKPPQILEDRAKSKKEYLMQMQNEIKEKEDKKRREKEDRMRRDKEELQKQIEYNPFGKGGAGAPLRDVNGQIIVNRKQQVNQQEQQVIMRQQQFQMNNNENMYPQPQMMMGQQQYVGGGGPPSNFMQQPPMMYDIPPMQQQNNRQGFNDPYFSQQAPPQINMKPQVGYSNHQSNDPFQNNSAAPQQSSFNQGLGAFNENEKERQKNQKQELQNVLKQQMEEQKRRKEEEVRKKREEEAREEERVQRERQKLEEEFKNEEMQKKKKVQEFQQANANIMQQKSNNVVKGKTERSPVRDVVVEKPPPRRNREDLFGGQGNAVQQQVEFKPQFEGFGGGGQMILPIHENQNNFQQPHHFNHQPTPQMYSEQNHGAIDESRIIKDISKELKHNLQEELDKLRQEMNSQQRAFREQIERLQVEANKSNGRKEEALMEIEKVKADLRAHRDSEREKEQNLYKALDKYNPNSNKPPSPATVLQNYDRPGPFPNNQYGIPPLPSMPQAQMNGSFYKNNRASSRQEVREDQRKKQIGNYEKMFFNKGSTEDLRPLGQYAPAPQKPGFNVSPGPYQTNQNKPIKALPQDIRGTTLSMSGTLMGESELVPLDPNQMSSNRMSFKQAASKPSGPQPNAYLDQLDKMGAGKVRLDTESAVDTMDFVNKIVNGGGGSNKRPDLPSQQPQRKEGYADKLDTGLFDFNFPQIPAYEGIQGDLLKFDNVLPQQKQQQQSYLPKPDIFSNAYQNHMNSITPNEKTNMSIASLNSLNLDRINQRNEDRMQKLGVAFDNLDLTNNTSINYSPDQKQNMNPNLKIQRPLQSQSILTTQNDQLKNVDGLLFDILRSNEPPPSQNTKRIPSAGRLSHINQNNNFQRMRDSRDQFIAPKMGQIREDNSEYDGTLKNNTRGSNPFAGIPLPSDMRRLDSLFGDTNSLAMP